MRLVVQRVTHASVAIDGEVVGTCGKGYMVLVGAQEGDSEKDVSYCIDKTANLRIFEDEDGKMNLSIRDVGGSVLAISQFTLLGDARHGRRPSFIQAARPETAKPTYEMYCDGLRAQGIAVETGIFQADMQVALVNDGPVTILVDSRKDF